MGSFVVIMFTQEDLSVALKCFAQAVTNCLLQSAENTKRAMFYILITITLEVNMVLALLHFRTPLRLGLGLCLGLSRVSS